MALTTVLRSWSGLRALTAEVIKDLVTQALQYLVGRMQGRVVARAYAFASRPLPFCPKESATRWLRSRAPKSPQVIQRVVQRLKANRPLAYSGGPSDLPPQGLVGVTGRRVLVFHSATKLGPHVEAYICHEDTAYNVGVKRLSPEVIRQLDLRRNGGGWLTLDSQARLKEFWASEFQVGKTTWLAQSTDHRYPSESNASWSDPKNGPPPGSYGAGDLRQVLADDPVVFSTLGNTAPSVEWHDPILSKHNDAFAFRLMGRRIGKTDISLLHGFYTGFSPNSWYRFVLAFISSLGLRPIGNVLLNGASSGTLSGALSGVAAGQPPHTQVGSVVPDSDTSGVRSGTALPNILLRLTSKGKAGGLGQLVRPTLPAKSGEGTDLTYTKERQSNILGVGLKQAPPAPEFNKLKLIFKHDAESFLRAVGPDGYVTIKEDGASVKGRSDRYGTQFWSPRYSKTTGQPINYTWRFRDWRAVKSDTPIEFKGELLIYKGSRRLSAAQIGGLLNQDVPIPQDHRLELVVYSIDKVGRADLSHTPHTKTLVHLHSLTDKHADWRAAISIPPTSKAVTQACVLHEGAVGVPVGSAIIDGYKIKTRPEAMSHDWRIDSVDLRPGAKGGIAGTVTLTSLESGRQFKLGGGPLGPLERRESMLQSPEEWVGTVLAVRSLNGHEGRAAIVVSSEVHPDKGLSN